MRRWPTVVYVFYVYFNFPVLLPFVRIVLVFLRRLFSFPFSSVFDRCDGISKVGSGDEWKCPPRRPFPLFEGHGHILHELHAWEEENTCKARGRKDEIARMCFRLLWLSV